MSFGYTAEKTVLHDLSLEAKPGQTVAIVGHTGAGKTTIINLLMRFYELQQGQILVDEKGVPAVHPGLPPPQLRHGAARHLALPGHDLR